MMLAQGAGLPLDMTGQGRFGIMGRKDDIVSKSLVIESLVISHWTLDLSVVSDKSVNGFDMSDHQ